jgi:hypothetical protein
MIEFHSCRSDVNLIRFQKNALIYKSESTARNKYYLIG